MLLKFLPANAMAIYAQDYLHKKAVCTSFVCPYQCNFMF